MKKSRNVLLVLAFAWIAIIAKSQTGSICTNPKILVPVNNSWQGVDSFTVDSFFIRFQASYTQYHFKFYIKNLSSNPNYKVRVLRDSCGNLGSNLLTDYFTSSNDTISMDVGKIVSGNNYLISIKNNNSTAKTVYDIFVNGVNTATFSSFPSQPPCELVYNGDFESTSGPPTGISQLPTTFYNWFWGNVSGTSDAFSSAAGTNSIVAIPCNFGGKEFAHSGNGYAGYIATGASTYYEYIQTQLTNTLVPGRLYELSFWVSKGEYSISDIYDLAVYTHPFQITMPSALPYTIPPTFVETNTVTLNTYNGWAEVRKCFVASGGENWLSIGPYGTASNTIPKLATGCTFTATFAGSSYMYVDDVSLRQYTATVSGPTVMCTSQIGTFNVISNCTASCVRYDWDFGEGTTVTDGGTSVPFLYSTPGTYTLMVSAIVPGTYTLNMPHVITIYAAPTVTITSNVNSVCNQSTESFTANITPPGSGYTYTWTTSTGTIVSGQGTSVMTANYNGVIGPVNVGIIVTNSLGCSSYSVNYVLQTCCNVSPGTVVYTSGYAFATNTVITGGKYYFSGNATINPSVSVTFQGAEVMFSNNVSLKSNSSSTLNVFGSYLHGCGNVWDGLYTGVSSKVHLENNIIQDAQRALVDSLGADIIWLYTNVFNKNYKGVTLKATTTANTFTLVHNVFTSSNLSGAVSYTLPITHPSNINNPSIYYSLPSVNVFPPYATSGGSVGIECLTTTGASSAYIKLGSVGTGTANSAQNLFNNLFYGIYLSNARAQVLNAYFQNQKRPSSNAAGVYVMGTTARPLTVTQDIKIGTASNEQCYFDNNNYGVYNYYPAPLLIQRNSFSNNDVGIYVNYNHKAKLVSVLNNTLTNHVQGVLMDYNVSITASIRDNVFNNTTAKGTTSNNYAITMNESSTPTVAIYDVSTNTVTGYYQGMAANGTYSTNMAGNMINLRAENTVTTTPQYGAWAILCNLPTIRTNSISITSGSITSTWQRGIGTDVCTLPSVLCNSITGVSVHIKALGLNWTSTNGNGYCGNIMNDYNYGFWLDGNGEIGDQFFLSGATKYSADNQWFKVLSTAMRTQVTANSNTVISPSGNSFYTRNTPGQYSIPSGEYFPNTCGPVNGCPLLGINSSSVNNTCISGGGGGAGMMANLNSLSYSGELMQNANNIAATANTNSSYSSLDYWGQRALYQNLRMQNIKTSGNTDLTLFKQTVANKNLGKLFAFDDSWQEAVSKEDFPQMTNANNINSGISSAYNFEQNQKTFNVIYTSYLSNNNTLTQNEIATLETLAALCPLTDGASVFQARALLFRFTNKSYRNSCEDGDISLDQNVVSRLINTPELEARVMNGIKLYPNPAADEIFVEVNGFTNCELIIYNLMGQQIISKDVQAKTSIDISKLAEGTYIYKIKQGNTQLKVDKLIINR